jgi:DNA primase catalytic core
MLEKISESCRYLLHNYPGADDVREYLHSRLMPESIQTFQFGYFPQIHELHLLTDLVGDETLVKHKLIDYRNIEDSLCPRTVRFCFFEHYPLVMPFRDPYGKVVALVSRTLLDPKEMAERKVSKYKNTYFKKGNYLFGLYENKQHILDQDCVYIVEGQFDLIKAMEHGIRNIVALGNNNMTSYQFSLISRYTNNLIMLLDNDEAGTKGRKLAQKRFGHLANIQDFYIQEGYKDIDEYLTLSEDESPSFVVKG